MKANVNRDRVSLLFFCRVPGCASGLFCRLFRYVISGRARVKDAVRQALGKEREGVLAGLHLRAVSRGVY